MASACEKCNYFPVRRCKCEEVQLQERIEELEAENKKMKELKCPPISSGDSCICPIEELETMLIKKDERIEEFEAKLDQHRWIPVSERLPENVATVFILTGEGAGGIGFYGEEENRWERLDHAINLNITYWKPIILPK